MEFTLCTVQVVLMKKEDCGIHTLDSSGCAVKKEDCGIHTLHSSGCIAKKKRTTVEFTLWQSQEVLWG